MRHNEDEQQALLFGGQLQQLISEYFTDSQTGITVSRILQDVYMPDNDRRRALETIISQLQQ